MDEAAIRTWETMNLGDEIDAEVGSKQMLARFAENSPNTVVAALPSATVGWHDGNSTFRYRLASMLPGPEQADEGAARNWMPQLSLRDGELAIEHGMHQEFGWERRTETSGVAVLVYGDNIDNPVMQAMGHYAGGSSGQAALLYDPTSGLLHAAGPNFTSAGMLASVDHRLPGGNQVRFSYANGNALTMGENRRRWDWRNCWLQRIRATCRATPFVSPARWTEAGRTGRRAIAGSRKRHLPALRRTRWMPPSLTSACGCASPSICAAMERAALRRCSRCAICLPRATVPTC